MGVTFVPMKYYLNEDQYYSEENEDKYKNEEFHANVWTMGKVRAFWELADVFSTVATIDGLTRDPVDSMEVKSSKKLDNEYTADDCKIMLLKLNKLKPSITGQYTWLLDALIHFLDNAKDCDGFVIV